ncbi:Ig-like domain-containing protein, partial [Bacteroides thetaiotaomicron]|uniref:Ig-like domain-containing protein n=1 Tax=Bacteroides thetaiotaomicron TaxID=818 RepID=UPI0018AABBB2
YFEYDDAFVNYLAQSVANQYKIPLELLGLWHRHPGSMDVFSSTDDGTNTTFALQNPSGVISGLVNIDPQFRLTMYHMENPRNVVRQYTRPNYERIDVEVGDDIIPEEYFQLKYYDGEGSNLNPFVERSHTRMSRSVRTEGTGNRTINEEPLDIRNTIQGNLNREDENYVEPQDENPSWMNDLTRIWEILKKNKIMSLIALILVIASIFSFKTAIEWCKSGVETVISWVSDDDKKEPCISEDEVTLKVGNDIILTAENVTKDDKVTWSSSNKSLATVDNKGKVLAKKEGDVEITLTVNGKHVDSCQIEIEAESGKPETSNYKLSAEQMTLKVNETGVLTLEGAEDISEITWTSTNNSVATVANGKVTAKQVGIAKIIASIAGKSKECKVEVKPIDEPAKTDDVTIKIPGYKDSGTASLELTVSSWNVEILTTGPLKKDLIKFVSEKPNIATVTPDGIVKPIALGTTNIVVSYNGQEQDTLSLTIVPPKKK